MTKANVKYPMVLSPEFGSHLLQPSNYENFYTAKVSMAQPSTPADGTPIPLRLARASLKQARTRYETVKRETVLSLKTAFFGLSRAKSEVKLTQDWLDRMKGTLARMSGGSWEYIEARALISEMENTAAQARQQLSVRKLEYLKNLNRELDSSVETADDFLPDMTSIDLDKAVTWAMELRPEVKSEVYRAEMDSIALNLAMSRRSPTVMLGASYDVVGYQFPLPSNSWEATLAIQFPLAYDFWTQITQRKAEQRQGDLKRSSIQDKVRLEVRQYHQEPAFLAGHSPQTAERQR